MDCRFSREVLVLQTHCDRNLELSIPAAVGFCIDTATIQTETYGFGVMDLKEAGKYWVVSKQCFSFPNKAHMMDRLKVTTWPEKPGRARCNRDLTIERDGVTIALGKSEWAVIDSATGRPTPPADIYPDFFDLIDDTNFEDGFARITDDFDSEPFAGYRVSSVDIDMAMHMNNVRYFWVVMSLFPAERIEAMNIREIELHYKSQAVEGETLRFQKREKSGAMEIRASAADGRTVLLARITGGK